MAGPIAHLTVRISGQIAELQKDMKTATNAVQGFATETKKISGTVAGVASSLKGFAATVGVAFTAQAVVGFIGHVLDAASQIKDLSTQLGISTDAVQGFKFAAEQSGSSLDAVGTAIQKMNQNLSAGEKGTVAALTKAGLKFDEIRQMRPEDAFLDIADAIQKIPDPMLQAEVALRLFGRGAAELLPGIKEGFRSVAEGADKMSAETIRDLEAAQDAWTKLWNGVTIASGGIIGSLLSIGETTSLVLEKGVPHAVDTALLALTKMNEEMARSVKAPAAFTAGGAGKAGQFTPTDSVEDILRISGEMATASNKVAKAHKGAADAGNQHAEAIRRLRDSLSGDGAIQAANDMVEALRGLPSVQNFAADKALLVERTMQAATEAYKQQGREVPPLIRMILLASMDLVNAIPVVNGLSNEFERLGQVVAVTASEVVTNVPVIAGLGTEFGRIGTTIEDEVIPPTTQWQGQLDELSRGLAQLSQVSGDAFGGIVSDLAVLVSSLDTANKGFASFRAGMSALSGGSALAGILGMSSGILGIASAALAAGKAIRNMFGGEGRAVNDARDSFLLQFGPGGLGADSGFHQLAGQLHELGASGDALFQKLVRTTDMAAFERAVAEVNAALAQQKTVITDAGEAATKAGAAQVIATTKAQDAIRAMDDELSALFKSVENEAFEVEMGNIEKEARARISIVEKEKTAAQLAIIQTGEAGADVIRALDTELARLDGTEVTFRVKWDVPPLPGGSVPSVPGGGSSTQPIVVQSQLIVDGDVFAESLVNTLARLGVH